MRLHEGAFLFVGAVFSALGCGAESYVWVDAFAPSAASSATDDAYVIASGDLLNIRVYGQDAISTHGRVGLDGKIAVPLAGEVVAKGLRPLALSRLIEERLRPFIVAPSVAVVVDEAQPVKVKVAVIGEVAHPAVLSVAPETGVLEVLALAGGLTEYAARDRIFVLRNSPTRGLVRIRFTYRDLSRGTGKAPSFHVETGDTVVVE